MPLSDSPQVSQPIDTNQIKQILTDNQKIEYWKNGSLFVSHSVNMPGLLTYGWTGGDQIAVTYENMPMITGLDTLPNVGDTINFYGILLEVRDLVDSHKVALLKRVSSAANQP